MTQSGQGGEQRRPVEPAPGAEPWAPPPGHVVGPGYEGPGTPHGYGYPPLPDAVTQYIPPVPAAPGGSPAEAATQYIPPVPAAPGGSPAEAATQYIPPVPAGPGDYDALFRSEGGHTQVLPPIVEPVAVPPARQGAVAYEQDEGARRPSPVVIAAAVFGLAVVGLGVGTLLGDGKAGNDDPAAAAGTPAPAGSASAPASSAAEAPVDPARAQAVQLDKLLGDSNDSRSTVIDAVENIKSCKSLDDSASSLREAARQRGEMVTRLNELKIDKLQNSTQLAASLTKAWQSSAAADNHYAAWAEELDDRKKDCKGGHARPTGHTVDANKASGEATRAKETAATLWNKIAAQYGLTPRDKAQL
ncbi:hypothetical protein [Streptomyces sp. WAC06614]|uniref:hypothetical protein n=1 Tax=Streptomyces sp. WAC06614 TaxID=2487416 RepID=UPI0021B02986|nr:hypothetical protein [Streptomyces sp. WAC06614]